MRKASMICFFLFLSVYGCSFERNLSYEEHFEKATKYFESKRLDKAIEEYKKALRLRPTSADAHYYLGLAYEQNGRILLRLPQEIYRRDDKKFLT